MNPNRIKLEPIDTSIKKSSHRIFICEKCQIHFSNKDTLNAHRHHYCKTNTKRNTYSIDSILMKGIKRQLTDDDDDDNSMMTMKRRLAVWKFHNPIEKMIYIPISLISPAIQTKPIYRCQFCSIHFLSFETLQAHQQNYCVQSDFVNSNRLKSSHMSKHVHSRSILFKCTICCAMFDNEDKYFEHIDCVHTNERFLECLECRSRFSSKWNLIQHMKLSHTNIKSSELTRQTYFSCSFCQIKFQQIETLEEHMRNYCISRIRKQKPILSHSYSPNRRTTN